MRTETFRGRDLHGVLHEVRKRLGDDALILRTHWTKDRGARVVEVVAAKRDEVDAFRRRITDMGGAAGRRSRTGKHVVALVGPTGAGKTTTLAKLSLHPHVFGSRRPGLITLDTYRVAAVEQLQLYADIAGLPCEVVYDASDLAGALERLSGCDVILVDAPGRSPRAGGSGREWHELLRRIGPSEVHLVLPATIRTDVALAIRDELAGLGLTHVLLTKLDEVPGELGVAELAYALELPARWVTDGQDVPDALQPAATRLMASLGFEELIARAG
ncbi:MAG TPA: hypothetical protein VKZ58_02115 [Longimicrobiales bacterium]|nr:hypothetical protein [Longimicrobiales bacterium]